MTDREIVEKIDEIIGKIDYMEENPETGMAVKRAELYVLASALREAKAEVSRLRGIVEGEGDIPTRSEYAKWVAFYISAMQDEEARAAGCVKDGLDMLRRLYDKERSALKLREGK